MISEVLETPTCLPALRHQCHGFCSARSKRLALAISPRLLWSMTRQGQIRCLRLGKAVRYDPNDLSEWINRAKGAK